MTITDPVANTTLVVMSWLGEIFPSSMISSTLPNDNTTWAASGFITVTPAGGSTDNYTQMTTPLIYVDCWAVKPNSDRAPWGKANNIAEQIRRAAMRAKPHVIALPGGYPSARFYSISRIGEPIRREGLASYARYNFSMDFNWAPVIAA